MRQAGTVLETLHSLKYLNLVFCYVQQQYYYSHECWQCGHMCRIRTLSANVFLRLGSITMGLGCRCFFHSSFTAARRFAFFVPEIQRQYMKYLFRSLIREAASTSTSCSLFLII
jgi:hypothetical protein